MREKWDELLAAADRDEIGLILEKILKRHRELYPQWELSILALDRRQDRSEQIERIIGLLEKIK